MLQYFAPDIICRSITDIPLDELKERGIRGLLFDLDNTITEWQKDEVTERNKQWLHDLREQGFSICIVSNNHAPRVKRVAEQLGLPCLHSAAKPRRKSYWQAAALLKLAPQQLAMVGDQLLTDVLGGNIYGVKTVLAKPIKPEKTFFQIACSNRRKNQDYPARNIERRDYFGRSSQRSKLCNQK